MYNFETLSPIDFELLCSDLLSNDLDYPLETFKAGKDRGIDLRYIDDKITLIVQCKHYIKSGSKVLLRDLKTKELPKVKKLQPTNYIIATSVELSVKDKDDILKIFNPYITSISSIYDNHRLNKLINQFPEIEYNHFKLWLSSSNILQKIVNSDLCNSSLIRKNDFHRKLSRFVPNEGLEESRYILEKNNFCVLSGEPGIGKTITAEFLCAEYIKDDYQFILITDNISQAYSLYNPEKKQIFLYDDFLGEINISYKISKNEIKSIESFITTLRNHGKSKIVFTTREYILNTASIEFETVNNIIPKLKKCLIDYGSYTYNNRAEILFNHLLFSDLQYSIYESLLEKTKFYEIIEHENYSPRLIEWMTDKFDADLLQQDDYYTIFIHNLNFPSRIWEHVIINQITENARLILILLSFLPKYCDQNILKKLFFSYSLGESVITTERNFDLAIKELNNSLITIYRNNNSIDIMYYNPSIHDYIIIYLDEHTAILNELIEKYTTFSTLEEIYLVTKMKNNYFSGSEFINLKFKGVYEWLIKNKELFILKLSHLIKTNKAQNNEVLIYKTLSIYKEIFTDNNYKLLDNFIPLIYNLHEIYSKSSVLDILELVKFDNEFKNRFINKKIDFFDKFFIDLIYIDDIDYLLKYLNRFSSLTRLTIDVIQSKIKSIFEEQNVYVEESENIEELEEFIIIIKNTEDKYNISADVIIKEIDKRIEEINLLIENGLIYDDDYEIYSNDYDDDKENYDELYIDSLIGELILYNKQFQ